VYPNTRCDALTERQPVGSAKPAVIVRPQILRPLGLFSGRRSWASYRITRAIQIAEERRIEGGHQLLRTGPRKSVTAKAAYRRRRDPDVDILREDHGAVTVENISNKRIDFRVIVLVETLFPPWLRYGELLWQRGQRIGVQYGPLCRRIQKVIPAWLRNQHVGDRSFRAIVKVTAHFCEAENARWLCSSVEQSGPHQIGIGAELRSEHRSRPISIPLAPVPIHRRIRRPRTLE